MNIVAIIGNVASDPVLTRTEQGRALCTYRVAVSRLGDDQTADFFEIVSQERQAELCAEYLDIGRRIAVTGRLRCTVTDHDGERRTHTEVVACHVDLLSPNPRIDQTARAEQAEVAR